MGGFGKIVYCSAFTLAVFSVVISSVPAIGEEVRAAESAELLSKAQAAVQWIKWSESTLKVHQLSSTPGPPKQFAGLDDTVTVYRSPDGRLDVRSEVAAQPDNSGKFVASHTRMEAVFADGQFLTYWFGENTPPGPQNGYVRVLKKDGGAGVNQILAICNDAVGGFLEGNFVTGDAKPRSVVELAREGRLTKDISDDTVNGFDCKMGEWETPSGTLRVWIAPSQGYNVVQMALTGPMSPSAKQRPLWVPSSVRFEVTAFKRIDNQIVAAGGRCETVTFNEDTGQVWTTATTAERTNVRFKPQFTDSTLFTSKNVPDGLRVMVVDDTGPRHINYVWSHGEPKPAVDPEALAQIDTTLHSVGPPAEITIKEHSHSLLWVILIAALGGVILLVCLANRKGKGNASH